MTKLTFAERCQLAEQWSHDAPYQATLTNLHAEMLSALAEQPAQQEPLTDEQIVAKALHLSGLGTSPDVIQFARAIEAAHGITKGQP